MERTIYKDLQHWKNRPDRKPLILLGARQVGKTYILQEFGRWEFENKDMVEALVSLSPQFVGLAKKYHYV